MKCRGTNFTIFHLDIHYIRAILSKGQIIYFILNIGDDSKMKEDRTYWGKEIHDKEMV